MLFRYKNEGNLKYIEMINQAINQNQFLIFRKDQDRPSVHN